MVVGGGFEPPKLARQIYSLIPLATRESHHASRYTSEDGAGTKSRTRDLLITSQLLYQLSYTGRSLLKWRVYYPATLVLATPRQGFFSIFIKLYDFLSTALISLDKS